MKKPILSLALFSIYFFFFAATNQSMAQAKVSDFETNWPEWRGLYNTGAVSSGGHTPVEFSETKNIRWKIEIPGKGHATPIVWGNQVIVQTAVPTHKKGDGSISSEANSLSPNQTDLVHNFTVISYDKSSGKVNWQTVVDEEVPEERTHELGSWASNSPLTDGQNIYAYFGSRGLYCLDFQGNIRWKRDFGQMEKVMSFGEGSSPAIYKDLIFIQWDHQGQSYMFAVNKNTGKIVWQDKRDEISSWATPLVVEVNGKAQVITAATNKVRSYDAETGKIVWEFAGLTRNCIPCPTYGNGLLYLMSGYRGTALKAIDLAKAKGDISGTSAIVWQYDKDTPYTPSPVLMDGKLYFIKTNNGFLTCLDAKTGNVNYSNEKLEGISTLFSSPTGCDDKIYIAAKQVVDVIQAGSNFKLLASNKLDDTFEASPIVVGNDLILRGEKYLYCISGK